MSTISVALERIGRGLLGIWCASLPLLLIFSASRFEAPPLAQLAPLALIVGFLVFPYALAIWKIRNQGLRFLKAVVIDTVLFVVFSEVVGRAIRGLVAGFGGPKLPGHILFPILFALLGFWVLEATAGPKGKRGEDLSNWPAGMTIEARLQRIATVLSITGLIAGLLFTAVLAVASAREPYIYSQARAQLVAEGCPGTVADEHRDVLPAIEIVGPNRWLVILGERHPAAGRWRPYRLGAYVVSADRQVTKVEILEAARAADRDRTPPDLARWRPTADIEVIDCIMEGQEIVRVHYDTALSTRLLGWWGRQGARLGLRSWMNNFGCCSKSGFVAGDLISALMLTVIAAALPRWMFYFVRRIVRRFAATDASV